MARADEFDLCARRLKALGDPTRLRILKLLLAGPRNVTDLAAELHDELVNVSHHLGVLRNADIVESHKAGRFVEYAIHSDVAKYLEMEALASIDFGCCQIDQERKKISSPPTTKKA